MSLELLPPFNSDSSLLLPSQLLPIGAIIKQDQLPFSPCPYRSRPSAINIQVFTWPAQSTSTFIYADVVFVGVSGHYIAFNQLNKES